LNELLALLFSPALVRDVERIRLWK
jgi:hypothetical protein